MSGVIGVVGGGALELRRDTLESMVRTLAPRGADLSAVWHGDGASLAVVRSEWELRPGFSGEGLVVEDERLVVVADASLYYRADLENQLRAAGAEPRGNTPSHLIAAAYRQWGPSCVSALEGDFAFVVWDKTQHQCCFARDFAGKRPLFYAQADDTVIVASTIASVLAHPDCPADLNVAHVGATATGSLWTAGPETSYRAVRRVLAGQTMLLTHERLTSHAVWEAPVPDASNASSFEDGAAELRALLKRAVTERLDPTGTTTVWLSGGWDSTAVWGAANAALNGTQDGRRVQPVSISYPVGDPGREDDLITACADFWGSQVEWLDSQAIPIFDRPADRAARRDEPFAHMFEMWIRALAQGTRAAGSRVALDGFGGDQLFQVSDVYLSDLLRAGAWRAAWRDWRSKGGRGVRPFLRQVVKPALPEPLARGLASLRRTSPPRSYLERPLAPWVRSEFVRRTDLRERERAFLPSPGAHLADAETQFYLTAPYFYLVGAHVGTFSLETGVECRSPLFDRRIVEFAMRRPRTERASGRETKRLLRASMHGLLPESVLAPRPTRTGVTSGYAEHWMRHALPSLTETLFRAPMVLVDLGVIDAERFRRAALSERARRDGNMRVMLFLTLQTELWLRHHYQVEASGDRGRWPATTDDRHVNFLRSFGSQAAPGQLSGSTLGRPDVREASSGTFRNVPRAH